MRSVMSCKLSHFLVIFALFFASIVLWNLGGSVRAKLSTLFLPRVPLRWNHAPFLHHGSPVLIHPPSSTLLKAINIVLKSALTSTVVFYSATLHGRGQGLSRTRLSGTLQILRCVSPIFLRSV